ncbi:phosphatase PAP2 family protein [Hymenobacter sp. BT188]|uniref:phosphatase PAP2 family protein n=1 Tax=Hymenobacter sp. BT188 TaxID=2763504 RepID=UPI001651A9F0|nr:phosphatase PAP2 family protein [Hymenobacter sp. BT188]MBC6608987.1 phosphatase PAP2 family protein [Hymenobacter sp. BT188]
MLTFTRRFPLHSLKFRIGLVLLLSTGTPVYAQIAPQTPADTLRKYETPAGATSTKPWYRGKLVRATIVPAVMIGYGFYTHKGGGFYTNEQANRDIHKLFPTYRTRLDDYLLLAPYAELGLVALAGVESRNDRINTLLVIGKAEAIMLTSVFALKHITRRPRPDGSDNEAFPSGHTAQAFLAASIVHTEFRDKSQWYGIGAYTIATGVGALRMINTKHWQSDVVAGAGFGILSAHLAYLTHRNRWGRKPRLPEGMTLTPTLYGGATGLCFIWRPQ